MNKDFLTPTKDGVLLNLRVSPGAKRTTIEGFYGEGALKLKVAAPPAGGKANAVTERFLADLLGVPRSNVALIRGSTHRDKGVLVRGASAETLREALTRPAR